MIEEEGKRNTTIGPEKYALSQVNGDYSWHANGLRARCNIHVDMLAKFVSVLKGNVESVSWWVIQPGVNFGLYHSEEGVTKKMRFICLKGAVEGSYPAGEDCNLRIRWWKDEAEFIQHASGIRPLAFQGVSSVKSVGSEGSVGVDDHPIPAPQTEKIEPARENLYKSPIARIDEDVRSFVQVQEDELGVGKQKIWVKPAENPQRVYLIREADGGPGSYVGWTPLPMYKRLEAHNDGTGAIETNGKQWEVVKVMKGFDNKKHAKSFEGTMHQEYNEVSCWQERIPIMESLMKLANFQFVHVDRNPMLVPPSEKKKATRVKKDWRTLKKAAVERRSVSQSSIDTVGTSTSASSGLSLGAGR